MAIRIVTDSGSDIGQDVAESWGITVLPLPVSFGKEQYLDGIHMTADAFYTRMIETREIPRTRYVSAYRYYRAFARAVEAGDTVICITTSSGLSGCHRSALAAAQSFGDRVTVVDSLNACASLFVLVRHARTLVQMGKTHEEIVSRLERDKHRLHVISLCDTLEYVKRGGRVSRASALSARLFHTGSIITVDEGGKVRVIGRGTGRYDSFKVFTQLVEEAGGIDFSMPVCMSYSGLTDRKMLDYMKKEAALFEGREKSIHRTRFGATIGTYSGPDAFAIGFFHRRVAAFF